MLYNQGVILTKIQRLLGHRSVLTTERYIGVKFEETREAIQTLEMPLVRALNGSINCMPIALPEARQENSIVSIN